MGIEQGIKTIMTTTPCDKKAYDTRKQAETAAKHMMKRMGKTKQRAYKCDKCPKFHLTSHRKKIKHDKKPRKR